MSRRVKVFSGDLTRERKHTTPSEQLQAWLDECDADEANVYDIGEPIVYNSIYLLVMYNVEPAEVVEPPICNVLCVHCKTPKKHYCRVCDAGKPVQ
jgi:hypothetical protein